MPGLGNLFCHVGRGLLSCYFICLDWPHVVAYTCTHACLLDNCSMAFARKLALLRPQRLIHDAYDKCRLLTCALHCRLLLSEGQRTSKAVNGMLSACTLNIWHEAINLLFDILLICHDIFSLLPRPGLFALPRVYAGSVTLCSRCRCGQPVCKGSACSSDWLHQQQVIPTPAPPQTQPPQDSGLS